MYTIYWNIIPTKKSVKIISIQLNAFSPREYSHVTNIQIKKQNISRPPTAPSCPFAITTLPLKGNHDLAF